jgi:ribosomal protein S18 acetylase RimI-like enzyme
MTDCIKIISPASLQDVLQANSLVPEFASSDKFLIDEYALRCQDPSTSSIVSVATENDIPIGYLISYDRYHDGSLYVWMAAVAQTHRCRGVLRRLMQVHSDFAKRCVSLA